MKKSEKKPHTVIELFAGTLRPNRPKWRVINDDMALEIRKVLERGEKSA